MESRPSWTMTVSFSPQRRQRFAVFDGINDRLISLGSAPRMLVMTFRQLQTLPVRMCDSARVRRPRCFQSPRTGRSAFEMISFSPPDERRPNPLGAILTGERELESIRSRTQVGADAMSRFRSTEGLDT